MGCDKGGRWSQELARLGVAMSYMQSKKYFIRVANKMLLVRTWSITAIFFFFYSVITTAMGLYDPGDFACA